MRLCLSAFVLFLLTACAPELPVTESDPGSIDFSRVVFIGGHYLSGYRDGALSSDGQKYSIARLLAEQFAQTTGAASFDPASMPDLTGGDGFGFNLKPWESDFQSPSRLGDRTDCKGVVSLGPVKTLLNGSEVSAMTAPQGGTWSNLAFPFARMKDLTNPNFGLPYPAGNPWYHRYASDPGTSTIMSDAIAQDPTFFVMWPGMEDVYEYIVSGGTVNNLMSNGEFMDSLNALTYPFYLNGTKGVLANIPFFGHMPYFTTLAWNGLVLDAHLADSLSAIFATTYPHISFHEGNNGFVIEDPNAVGGVRLMHHDEYLTLSMPIDSIKCFYLGVVGQTVPDRYSLDSSERVYINGVMNNYNAAIKVHAATRGFAFVDMNAYFNRVHNGFMNDGVLFNSTFVSGNFFSLDGYTPSAKGAGLIANEFIKEINEHYGSTIYLREIFDLPGIAFP